MKCDFIVYHRKGNKFRHFCIRCRRITAWTPTEWEPYQLCRKKGWGDRLEWLFKFLGYSKQCGGCLKRKEKLNEIDRRLFRYLRGPRNETYSTKCFGPPPSG